MNLSVLMRMMEMHYGKKVILLLDEYDVPLAKPSSHKYYNKMLEIIRAMMSTALRDNTSVFRVILSDDVLILVVDVYLFVVVGVLAVSYTHLHVG